MPKHDFFKNFSEPFKISKSAPSASTLIKSTGCLSKFSMEFVLFLEIFIS